MKRIEVEFNVKMIIDVEDNQNIETVVNTIEIGEFDIDEDANIIACNITNRNYSNFLKK
jgi:hypothetical protein